MVKKITFTASANTHHKKTYTLLNTTDQKLHYTFTAQRDATIHAHFKLGSLEQEVTGSTDLVIELHTVEPNAQIVITGAVVTGTGQTHNLTTRQLHTAPHTQSSVTIKTVVQEKGTHTYQGVIRLENGSLQANAQQENKILQLGPQAKISSQPTLQILHDDVQCTHGTAISQLDLEQIFYIQTRGIKKALAEQLLIQSFLAIQ